MNDGWGRGNLAPAQGNIHDPSRSICCAVNGLVGEVVFLSSAEKDVAALAGYAYPNLPFICGQNQMMIPRMIEG